MIWKKQSLGSKLYEENVDSVCVVKIDEELAGTGFVIRDDGLIITNNHVVDGADKVTLEKWNDDSYDGVVIKYDYLRDLAAIKVIDSNKPISLPIALNKAYKPQVGEKAFVIGHPSNSSRFTFSRGQLGSVNYINEENENFIQLDVSINWGNSGGPVLSASGELIGVATQINIIPDGTPHGTRIEGVSFAVPFTDVIEFISSIPDLRTSFEDYELCSSCGRLEKNTKYCSHCGSALKSEPNKTSENNQPDNCSACGSLMKENEKYCSVCGAS